MNQLFLLKLIAEMLDSDKPSPDEIACAKKIINKMIDDLTPNGSEIIPIDGLDDDAQQARQELM